MRALISRRVISNPVETLCSRCGLCCNGVIFADVRLQAADQPARLVALGVPLKPHGLAQRISQPCACLQGTLCRIYADRPSRCRAFECRLLKRAQTGDVTERAALKSIQKAQKRAERVRQILVELGDANEHLPLSRRWQRKLREPFDLSAAARINSLRGKLMVAASELAATLEKDFV